MKLAEHSHAPKSTNPVILMTTCPEPPLSHLNVQRKRGISCVAVKRQYPAVLFPVILINTKTIHQCSC